VSTVLSIAPVTTGRIAEQAVKTLIVMLVLIAGFRLTGKREMAQFNVYDLAMIIALSNAVQNAMTGGLGNLPVGVAVSTTVVVTAWLLTQLLFRRARIERRFLGTPTLLVSNGRVLHNGLRREHVTADQLAEACREHGVAGPRDCRMVVLEIDGSMSVIPYSTTSAKRVPPTTRRTPRRRRSRSDP
jgi:uncharacterized membrane protein YcaP (DUF421 family)